MSRLRELKKAKNETKNNSMIWLVAGIVVLLGIGSALFLFSGSSNSGNSSELNTAGLSFPLVNVHWHATPIVNVCGENKPIPVAPVTDHLLHTHEDRLIHIEGTVNSPEQITLGRFFGLVGVKFSSTQLLDKTNGDVCENTGQPGKVSMTVNGVPSEEFENHVVRHGETIIVSFD